MKKILLSLLLLLSLVSCTGGDNTSNVDSNNNITDSSTSEIINTEDGIVGFSQLVENDSQFIWG